MAVPASNPAASDIRAQATPVPRPLHAFDPSLLDTTVDPCVDFHQYSCGGWAAKNSIPPDRSAWGRETELADENDLLLKSILERAAGLAGVPATGEATAGTAKTGGTAQGRVAPRTPNQQKIGDAYAACMDTQAIERAGMAPLAAELAEIAAAADKQALAQLLASLALRGDGALFNFGSQQDFRDATQQIAVIAQPGLGLPEKGYYDRADTHSVELRQQYQQHVARMLVLAGEPADQAAKDAATVVRLETALADASLSRLEQRDPSKLYHKTPLAQFAANTAEISFAQYLRGVGAPALGSLNVEEPSYFLSMSELLGSTPLDEIKAYLRWTVLRTAPGTAVPAALDEEDFSFNGRLLGGQLQQQPRWKRCVARVDADLGEALGEVFLAERFSAADKQRTLTLARDVEAAMGRDLDTLPWMSAATKVQAREKLHAVANKIGYPDTWRDYSSLAIDPHDAYGDAVRAAAFRGRRDIAKIGRPLDRGEWLMSPPTVNAYYDPQMNDVNFPAGILQPPYFDPTQDDAVNYGDAGAVIGHELTHGFDDEGRQFDASGNLRDWWRKSDAKEFTRRSDCVAEEYSGFVAVDELHVNGQLTLGENLADLGGLRLAYLAYLDKAAHGSLAATTAGVGGETAALDAPGPAEYAGLAPSQQFFAAFGQGWCESRRPENARTNALTDPHAPERFRVNGVVQNLPEFARAFRCRAGQPMAPVKRCSVW